MEHVKIDLRGPHAVSPGTLYDSAGVQHICLMPGLADQLQSDREACTAQRCCQSWAPQQQGVWQSFHLAAAQHNGCAGSEGQVILPTQAGCLLLVTSTGPPPVGSASPMGTEAAGWPVMLHRNVKRIMAPVTGRLLSPLDSTSFLHSTGAVGLSFQMQSRALQKPGALNESWRLRQQPCLGWCHACQPFLAGCREGLHTLRLVHSLPALRSRQPQGHVPPGLPRCSAHLECNSTTEGCSQQKQCPRLALPSKCWTELTKRDQLR